MSNSLGGADGHERRNRTAIPGASLVTALSRGLPSTVAELPLQGLQCAGQWDRYDSELDGLGPPCSRRMQFDTYSAFFVPTPAVTAIGSPETIVNGSARRLHRIAHG